MNQNFIKSIAIFLSTMPLLCSLSFNTMAQSNRVRENFDQNWLFHKGDIRLNRAVKAGKYGGLTDTKVKVITGEEAIIAYTDQNKADAFVKEQWKEVTLPHDWAVEGEFLNEESKVIDGAPKGLVSHGFLPVGIGFYRKEFTIPLSDLGKKITIEFDGIFRNSSVWVNGHLLGNHLSGYVPANYDLTDVLRYGNEGENVILVKVDASEYEGWWYEGCGIYRHVWLNKTDKLHVARFGTFVTTPSITNLSASVNVETRIENEYKEIKNVKIASKIVDANGVVLNTESSVQKIGAFGKIELNQLGAIPNPKLWSPEHPYIYKILTEIWMEDKIIDTYETTFGVRTAEVRKDGFYLNGNLYPIKGTSNHQDFAGVGVALPDKINEYRIGLLKDMGSNAYRSAHNPPTPELMDICDSKGMLILNENRLLSSTKDGLNDLETLILRDRNHPSVILWCMENEESIEGTPIGTRILQTLTDLTRRLDPTRQITAAMNHGWNDAGYSDVLDVVGYNYGQRSLQYIKDKKQNPDRLMIATESTSFVSTRGEYEDNFKKGYVSNMGNGVGWGMIPGKDWEHIVSYPYLSGQFAWTGFDYRGEPTPIYQWPSVTSHFGIMDMCGFPKDGYYAYKSAWTSTPIVHIFPHWNWPNKVGEKIKLMGYTNCDEVELVVNNKSLGKRKVSPFERLEWETVYIPGKVEAYGYKNRKLVVKKVVETTGEPAQIVLMKDTDTYKANKRDVAVVNIAIKDAKGRVVPTANNLVKFKIEGNGKIIGTGNGNPSSLEADKASQRKAFNGYCQVLVEVGTIPGEIRVTAISEGLKSSTIALRVE